MKFKRKRRKLSPTVKEHAKESAIEVAVETTIELLFHVLFFIPRLIVRIVKWIGNMFQQKEAAITGRFFLLKHIRYKEIRFYLYRCLK